MNPGTTKNAAGAQCPSNGADDLERITVSVVDGDVDGVCGAFRLLECSQRVADWYDVRTPCQRLQLRTKAADAHVYGNSDVAVGATLR